MKFKQWTSSTTGQPVFINMEKVVKIDRVMSKKRTETYPVTRVYLKLSETAMFCEHVVEDPAEMNLNG